MHIATILVPSATGSLGMMAADPRHPQNVQGLVWSYDSQKQPEGKAGDVGFGLPPLVLGDLAAVEDRFFLLEGAVLGQPGQAPSPYEVVVTFKQDGVTIHEEVPPEGGRGSVGAENAPFVYRFAFQATV